MSADPGSLVGQLLLAAPSLLDPNFRHSAVLVVAHDVEGALGLVLDRPSPLSVAEAAPALAPLTGASALVHRGGPVRATAIVVLAEYRDPAACQRPIIEGLGLLASVDAATADDLLRSRVFAGYAGWGAGQLEAEIAGGAWFVLPARLSDVFAASAQEVWGRALRRLGPGYRWLASLPRRPQLN